jgi:putative hydrolase of the HAD superfamily
MVGDRIDNDIAPANRLGMTTIHLRVGRHRDQQALTTEDHADFTVEDCAGLTAALKRILNF